MWKVGDDHLLQLVPELSLVAVQIPSAPVYGGAHGLPEPEAEEELEEADCAAGSSAPSAKGSYPKSFHSAISIPRPRTAAVLFFAAYP